MIFFLERNTIQNASLDDARSLSREDDLFFSLVVVVFEKRDDEFFLEEVFCYDDSQSRENDELFHFVFFFFFFFCILVFVSFWRTFTPKRRRKNQISLATSANVEPSDAPGEGKKRFPLLAEESRHSRSEPRKYKHPQNEGCAVTYSFDTDAFGNFKVVEIWEDGVVKPMDAPGEGKKRAPEAMQEREKDDGWDTKKGHGLMFGYVEERNPDNAC